MSDAPMTKECLTAPQRKALMRARATPNELFENYGTRGLAHASRERMLKRLCDGGLFEPYVHGGWCLTNRGREIADILAESEAHP